MGISFKELCESLKKNPMYYFSLASKELFHSNFIVWLYEERKIQLFIENFLKSKRLINEKDTFKFESINRELHNFDIVFKCKINSDNTNIIIENKVKSYPCADQLKRYEEKAEKKFNCKCIFILLTFDSYKIKTTWSILSYSDFIIYIKNNLLNKDDCKERYLNDYIKLVEGLTSILEYFNNNKNTFLCTNDECVALREIKLYDFIAKRQFENLKSSLPAYNDGDVKTSTDFIKGEPIIDVYIEIEKIKIGIQVNGLNYRHFVIEPMLTKGCVAYSLEKIWFAGLPVPREDPRRINEYGFGEFKDKKNKQIFLHRSCAINPDMKREELAEQIKIDVDYLLENKETLADTIRKLTAKNPS